jgi:hypothetical protein
VNERSMSMSRSAVNVYANDSTVSAVQAQGVHMKLYKYNLVCMCVCIQTYIHTYIYIVGRTRTYSSAMNVAT